MKKYFNAVSLSYIFVLFFVFSSFGQETKPQMIETKKETSSLEFGQTVERAIAGGERHIYKLRLDQNQFIKIELEQTNCDVILSLSSPEKVNVFEFKDDNLRNGPEVQTAAVETAGE